MSEESKDALTFELPKGLEKDGEIHKEVVMRKPTVRDWIRIADDIEIRKIGKNYGDIPLGNTVGTFVAQGPLYKAYAIILSTIVERIGSIEKPTREDFLSMDTVDLDTLVAVVQFGKSGGSGSVPLTSASSSED